MKYREFILSKGDFSALEEQEHKLFLLHVQKAILLSLESRTLLTKQQRELCEEYLEKHFDSPTYTEFL